MFQKEEGFRPGGASLHSMMSPHGPDQDCFIKASNEELKPVKIATGTMVFIFKIKDNFIFTKILRKFLINFKSFMFESSMSMAITEWGQETCLKLDHDYYKCWQGLTDNFDQNLKI
jgi:homogentisate 1,2-dioxygenase